jgi:hypothetical protein
MTYTFQIPVDRDYAELLGRAVYSFSYYEWQVACILEKLCPGFLNEFTAKPPMTAGRLSGRFSEILKNAHTLPPDQRQRLTEVQQKFAGLVGLRDQLIHGHPYTATGGAQQLNYAGGKHSPKQWPQPQLSGAILAFEEGSIEANRVFYELWPLNP